MAHNRHVQTHGHEQVGKLIHWGWGYDVALAVAMAGRGRHLRSHLAGLLQLQAGQRVLDVGCGTGTLAVALSRRVGNSGKTVGVDASPEMISRAARKAAGKLNLHFQVAAAQALPFADYSFDAVVSTLVLHHLPESDRIAATREMARMVRPGGRLVIADVHPSGTSPLARTFVRRIVRLHAMGGTDLDAVAELLAAAGIVDVRIAPSPIVWLRLVSGRARPAA